MNGTPAQVVTITVDQEAETYESMSVPELIRTRSVASRRAIEAHDQWVVERNKVYEINRIIASRERRKA